MTLPSGTSQTYLWPGTTRVEDVPLPAKIKAVACSQGTNPNLGWTFLDQQGKPVDISDLLAQSYTCQVRMREAAFLHTTEPPTIINCTVITPTEDAAPTTSITALLPTTATAWNQILLAEWAVLSPAGVPAFTNLEYVWVEAGQYAQQVNFYGTPSVQDLRMIVRDVSRDGNLWLKNFEYDLSDFAWSIIRCVQEFQESLPPINNFYSTKTFPFRNNLMTGVAAYLMQIQATWYRRVHLPYQAAGISLDDKAKFAEYTNESQRLMSDWKKWMQLKKVQLNADGAYQSFGSAYGEGAYGGYGGW
jgi:hypothetical protein